LRLSLASAPYWSIFETITNVIRPRRQTQEAPIPRVLNFKRDGAPDGAVYIGRKNGRYGLPDSKWHNPFVIGTHGNRQEVIGHFKSWLYATPQERAEIIAKFKLSVSARTGVGRPLINDIHELLGRDLVCWCAPEPCHGDLLLRLANE
jgi:hypothetical protein